MAEQGNNLRFMTNQQRLDSIQSRPMKSGGKNCFPLKMPRQNFAVVLLGNRGLNTPCDEPAYQVVDICDTKEKAIEILEATGFQGVVRETHEPLLIFETNEATEEECLAHIDELVQAEEDHVTDDVNKLNQRKQFSKENTAPSMFHEWEKSKMGQFYDDEGNDKKDDEPAEPTEYPQMDVITDITERKDKDLIMPLMGDAIVVTVIGRNTQTPALIVHAKFSKFEHADDYLINTLSPKTKHSYMTMVERESWQYPNREEKHTDAGDVTYLDQGMHTFMQGHVNCRDTVPYVKSMVDEKDILAPEPDLKEPAPATRRGGATSVIMNSMSEKPNLVKKAVRHQDVDPNEEEIRALQKLGVLDEEGNIIPVSERRQPGAADDRDEDSNQREGAAATEGAEKQKAD